MDTQMFAGLFAFTHVVACCLFCLFFFFLLLVLTNEPLFLLGLKKKFGRLHRIVAVMFLVWLIVGVANLVFLFVPFLAYDIILACFGIGLTASACIDFASHKKVKNPASGVLDEEKTVAYDEMLEHGFYQGLNLVQILFFHVLLHYPALPQAYRLLLVVVVTLPWSVRHWFPVNSFSQNYKNNKGWFDSIESFLYRCKKYQYILYKHFLLHGLNISLALAGRSSSSHVMVQEPFFRLFWLSLNASYTMEFFLQTLVKKQRLSQQNMLIINQILMLAATLAALQVLIRHVFLPVGLLSMALNLLHRYHELSNVVLTMAITTLCMSAWTSYR